MKLLEAYRLKVWEHRNRKGMIQRNLNNGAMEL